ALGGLDLAVGILVDDATVTIENVERHLRAGESLENDIMIGAGEIALPAMVSTLCICIVFVPMFFLTGVAGYLFAPLAEAVMFAVLASYALSRTLVPTLVMWFERSKSKGESPVAADVRRRNPGQNRVLGRLLTSAATISRFTFHVSRFTGYVFRPLAGFQRKFERGFDRFRQGYHKLLGVILSNRALFAGGFLTFAVASWLLVPFLGQDFFPSVDAGTFRLHVRAHTGTRIE